MSSKVLRSVYAVAAAMSLFATAHSAQVVVNSTADDVFPDATGALFDINNAPVILAASKCTLRMAVAAANLDADIGGTNGCVGALNGTETVIWVPGGADQIRFAAVLAGQTILLNPNKAFEVSPPLTNSSATLFVTGPVYISGNGSSAAQRVTLDGGSLTPTNAARRIVSSAMRRVGTESVNGESMWVTFENINFKNARVQSAGGCVFSVTTIRFFNVDFENCESDNSTNVAAGGALFVRAPDNAYHSFRPDVKLMSVNFRNNRTVQGAGTSGAGGGAFFLGSSSGRLGQVSIEYTNIGGNATVDGNVSSGGYGGGSITRAEAVIIYRSNFLNNVARSGEAGGLRIGNTNGPVSVSNALINNNRTLAGGVGGLLLEYNSNGTQLRSTLIQQNVALGGSTGGLAIRGNWDVTVSDSFITANEVTDNEAGGFTVRDNTSVSFERTNASANRAIKVAGFAPHGAGVFANNKSLQILNSQFSGNTTADWASVRIEASYRDFVWPTPATLPTPLPPTTNVVNVYESSFAFNTAHDSAGITLASPGQYIIRNSTFARNTVSAPDCGSGRNGGISIDGFNPNTASPAINVTMVGNTLGRSQTTCQVSLAFGAWNPGTSSNGAVNGALRLSNNIFASVAPGSLVDTAWALDMSKVTGNNNLFENPGSFGAFCGQNGNLCDVDPLLGVSSNHGGVTSVLPLLAGSPAINAGATDAISQTDQRGVSRTILGAPDMGAYEVNVPYPGANCSLDMDGANGVQAFREGLVLVRSMLGFSSSAAVNGTGITEAQWTARRAFLNANCGMSLP